MASNSVLQIPTNQLFSRSSPPSSNVTRISNDSQILPLTHRSDCSDSNPSSAWSRKIGLALDGGGVRGYSSLLILKRLMFLVAEIEQGQRLGYMLKGAPSGVPKLSDEAYPRNNTSLDYPWSKKSDTLSDKGKDHIQQDEVTVEQITASVEATFSTELHSFKPHHYFDYIAGTSTGGLSAIMLARMEMDVDDALKQYDTVGRLVFARPRLLHSAVSFLSVPSAVSLLSAIRPKYKSRYMRRALKKVIAEGLGVKDTHRVPFASDSTRCRTIVLAQLQGSKNEADNSYNKLAPYMFRTYEHPDSPPDTKQDQKDLHRNPGPAHHDAIWKIGRATSAAPPYFGTITFGKRCFSDGGIVANNPSEALCTEVEQLHPQDMKLLISIGTGVDDNKIDTRLRHILSHPRSTLSSLKLSIKLATESHKTHVNVEAGINRQNRKMSPQDAILYRRFNVDGDIKKILLDEWKVKKNGSNQTIEHLRDATKTYLKKKDTNDQLLECARTLVMIRRRRAETDRWESFACNFAYNCPETDCTRLNLDIKWREQLRDHAYDAHRFVCETHIKNDDRLLHTCFWEQCQQDGVHVFSSEDKYHEHLKLAHGIDRKRIFRNRGDFEAWLDRGRYEPKPPKSQEAAQNLNKAEDSSSAQDVTRTASTASGSGQGSSQSDLAAGNQRQSQLEGATDSHSEETNTARISRQ